MAKDVMIVEIEARKLLSQFLVESRGPPPYPEVRHPIQTLNG